MKEIISDYIHCTNMEFIIKHPLVVLGSILVIIEVFEIIELIKSWRNKK
jgi:hypothetical protein